MINKKRLLSTGIGRDVVLHDRLVIFEKDGKHCEILEIEDINEDRILAPNYSVPWEDVTEYISPEGRVFVLHAPEEYIQETKHLAKVEMSTVIKHAIQYQKMKPEKMDLSRIMPWIAVIIMAIIMGVK